MTIPDESQVTAIFDVASNTGHHRRFAGQDANEKSAAYAASLTLQGLCVLTTITYSDGDVVEVVALPGSDLGIA